MLNIFCASKVKPGLYYICVHQRRKYIKLITPVRDANSRIPKMFLKEHRKTVFTSCFFNQEYYL